MPATVPNAAVGEPLLDAERFDCYAVALEFQQIAAGLLPRGCGALRDQLDRASISIVLNLAEGLARRARREKAHLYSIARGSAAECAAALDLAARRGSADPAACPDGRRLLTR